MQVKICFEILTKHFLVQKLMLTKIHGVKVYFILDIFNNLWKQCKIWIPRTVLHAVFKRLSSVLLLFYDCWFAVFGEFLYVQGLLTDILRCIPTKGIAILLKAHKSFALTSEFENKTIFVKNEDHKALRICFWGTREQRKMARRVLFCKGYSPTYFHSNCRVSQ